MMLRTQSARQQTGREQVKRDLTVADITVRRYQRRPSMSSSAATCPWNTSVSHSAGHSPTLSTVWDPCRVRPLNIRSPKNKCQVRSFSKVTIFYSFFLTLPQVGKRVYMDLSIPDIPVYQSGFLSIPLLSLSLYTSYFNFRNQPLFCFWET